MENNTLKLKYKIGSIEFEAEGPSEEVEKQRIAFVSGVLPAAVDAMRQTQAVIIPSDPVLEQADEPMLLSTVKNEVRTLSEEEDLSRTSLASFIGIHGMLNDQDFTLFAAYFDEKKNGNECFNLESLKQYYSEARRAPYSNNSELFRRLVKKGMIMEIAAPEGKTGKFYTLTSTGLEYIRSYQPKENGVEKKTRKARKPSHGIDSQYKGLTADDLNLSSYPQPKTLSSPKEQIIMIMYIITREGKGEWFTVSDILHLMINVFDLPSDTDKVNGVFKRNKSWFASEQDTANKKAMRRKLLAGGKGFAEGLIHANVENEGT